MSPKEALRAAMMRMLYRKWHTEEMSPMPPAFGVVLENHLNAPGQRGFVCASCGRAFAERPVYTVTVATARGPHSFTRCTACVAQHRYNTER